jgi:gliding motility-associated-like protein
MVNGVLVPSVITPDGDGKNDYFRINKTDGKMKLIIINKWGNEEFSSTDYLNDWNGRNNKGSELPADTYFYILIIDNTKIIKGSVLIKR